MDQNRFLRVIKKYQDNQLSESERLLMDEWMNEVAKDQNGESETWTANELQDLKLRVFNQIPESNEPLKQRSTLKLWVSGLAAASVLVLLGLFLFQQRLPTASEKQIAVAANEILPVEEQATITLDNGEVVELGDGTFSLNMDSDRISSEDGNSLWEKDNGGGTARQVVIRTPKGKQLRVALEDGTQVHINAGSSLTYPLRFPADERKVVLEGEGYFDVAHQDIKDASGKKKRKPFKVESSNQVIEVLGTKFNVKAYEDEDYVKTNLLAGLINLTNNKGEATLLRPNQQSILSKSNNKMRVLASDGEEAIGWMSNIFSFHNAGLKDILQEIERWYDIRVDIDKWPSDRFYGEIKRDEPLSKVLELIESSSKLRFKVIQVNNERRLVLK